MSSKPEPRVHPDHEHVEGIARRRKELGDDSPRIGLFLFECQDAELLRQTLERVPDAAIDWIEEIVVVLADPEADVQLEPVEQRGGREVPVRIHRPPRASGYGATRREAFEYALRRGFDHAVVMRGDGLHPPERLPDLLYPALLEGHPLVVLSRITGLSPVHRTAAAFQGRLLGTRLHDYLSGFRLYSADLLRCVPFQLDAEERGFDVEILIQCRALGISAHEARVPELWREPDPPGGALAHALRACWMAVEYRLHQLHVTRDGRYMVDPGTHYTFKQSPSGSHVQIVEAIQPGSEVLDLGCSQGLLTRPLRAKGVRVTGVDICPPERWAEEMDAYFERDLEMPLELPVARKFDYVIVADVIEHVRERAQLLRSVRRYLKEDGRMLISTPNIALWFYRLSLLAGRFEYGPRGVLDYTHVHLYTKASFRREVERAGFRVLRERVTSLPFEVVFRSTGRSRFIRAITATYHAAARLWPQMFAYQNILEAEITTLDDEATSDRGLTRSRKPS
ncbi:MAG: methyltransferase domain-containing protein [Deltaproteobacteria bacterium]|nr:methyltransferase domain-containing protein [Deltaproteobacteria bacterium]MBW2412996.1 methyltransferase domain-containing protein [Deltaproteobacteria bacterium]